MKTLEQKTIRTTMLLSNQLRDKIDGIQEKTDTTSMVDVIRNSVNLYDKLLDLTKEGDKIYVKDKNGTLKELIII